MDPRRLSRRKRYLLGAILALLAAIACNEHGLLPIDEAITVERQDYTTQLETNKIDILWVIDDSNSMAQEQEALIANFQTFIDGLALINADFRLAVITTDISGDGGRFQSGPGPRISGQPEPDCPETVGPVLDNLDYRTTPGDPDSPLDTERLRRDFGCIANVGVAGSGFEKGLDAMAAALSPEMLEGGPNAGFRRDDAWLAIVIVADENDCSDGQLNSGFVTSAECEWLRDQMLPVSLFADFVNTQVPGTDEGNRVIVAGIIGPDNDLRAEPPNDPQPSCTNPARGDAYAGYRYEEFITTYGDRGVVANICFDDFQDVLDEIARVIRENLAVKCLRERPRTCQSVGSSEGCAPGVTCMDPDPLDNSGLLVCSDFDLAVESRPQGTEEWTVMAGPGETTPAYDVHYDAANCPTGMGIEFTAGNEPGAGTEFRIRYPITIGLGGGTTDGTGGSLQQ